ncbi:MAG: DoxX family protein [Proteobacteria bacterium]|nr:DoxX family protein [Pseudomonadota bacterium]
MLDKLKGLMTTRAPAATLLVRTSVGWIFLSEGIQKLLLPEALGAGRMAKIGLPWSDVMGPFVGSVEVLCGALVLAGLLTRLAAVPLVLTMVVALVSTKLPILLGHGFWGFSLGNPPSYGFWSMVHESRTDLAMLLGALFLLVVGAGPWSFDARITARR